MGRRNRNKYKTYENIEVLEIASEGKAIAKHEDMIIFITGVIPGDIIDVQITRKRKSYLEGRAIKFHKYSDLRVDAFCKHFGVCGGCKWQSLPYDEQVSFKQKQVFDNFSRLGKFDFPEINTILKSEKTEYYRNKLEYTFSNKRWLTAEEIESEGKITNPNALGFHIPKMFDKIVDIKECFLQKSPSNEIRLEVKDYAEKNNLTFFDLREQVGLLRNLIIRSSTTGDLMIIFSFHEDNSDEIKDLLNHISDKFPEITSLMYVINEKRNDTILDQDIKLFKGNDFIFEQMNELKFKIGPKSFYQTNSEQALNLYQHVKDYAKITSEDVVYDLYTGTGTIANFVAKGAKKVVGLEYVPEAIEDAKINSELNKIENTEFYAGDIKDLLTSDFVDEKGKPDIIILDPPRAGLHTNVVKALLHASAKRIVYVSCNPATQARDIDLLKEKYKVTLVQPVDMFPHTHHVENIAVLELL